MQPCHMQEKVPRRSGSLGQSTPRVLPFPKIWDIEVENPARSSSSVSGIMAVSVADGLGGFPRGIDAELHENDAVLAHGSQRAQQPRQRFEQVITLLGVDEKTRAIRQVASQG